MTTTQTTNEHGPSISFNAYRKFKPNVGRFATEEEVTRYGGIIHTNEGDKPLEVDDFIAEDALGEWPIPYRKITNPTLYRAIGWNVEHTRLIYKSVEVRYAAPIEEETFTINGFTGHSGDYRVYSEGMTADQCWIVEKSSFESTYKTVEQLEQEQHAAWQARSREIEEKSKRTQDMTDEDFIELVLLSYLLGEQEWPLKRMTPQEMYLNDLPEERRALYL